MGVIIQPVCLSKTLRADQTAVPSKERGDRRRVQNQSYGDTSSYGNPTPYAAAPPVYGMLPTYASTVPAPPPAPAPASLGGAPPFGGYPTLPAAETTSQKIFVPNNLVGGRSLALYIPMTTHNRQA